MPMSKRLEELPVADRNQNQSQLSIANQSQLSELQIAAVKEFVEQLGGIENARRAVAALQELKKAA